MSPADSKALSTRQKQELVSLLEEGREAQARKRG